MVRSIVTSIFSNCSWRSRIENSSTSFENSSRPLLGLSGSAAILSKSSSGLRYFSGGICLGFPIEMPSALVEILLSLFQKFGLLSFVSLGFKPLGCLSSGELTFEFILSIFYLELQIAKQSVALQKQESKSLN